MIPVSAIILYDVVVGCAEVRYIYQKNLTIFFSQVELNFSGDVPFQ